MISSLHLLSTLSLYSTATLQSIEVGCDTILSKKAKVMISGSFDDISEEGSFEITIMKATINAKTEFTMGHKPTEVSQPVTTTHAWVSG